MADITLAARGSSSYWHRLTTCGLERCPAGLQLHKERIYLIITTVFDVITDCLSTSCSRSDSLCKPLRFLFNSVISIPVALIWKAQLNLQRKLIIGSLLSLSVFMIVIAIVRTALASLPNGVVDTSWLFFWQGIEAACAVIMVSLTSFRSLFGQQKRSEQIKMRSRDKSSGISNLSGNLSGPDVTRTNHGYEGI